MRVHIIVIYTLLVTTTFPRVSSYRRTKRGHADNTLKALLNIYKMNPLRSSKVYEAFSNQLLSTRPDAKRTVLNIDSNESTRLKEKKTGAKLRQIESIIHRTQKRTTREFRGFVVDSSTPESFMKSSIINDFLRIELYDTGDKIAQGNIKILVNNVDGKIFSDTSLNNINTINLQNKTSGRNLHLNFLDDISESAIPDMPEYTSNEDVIVMR